MANITVNNYGVVNIYNTNNAEVSQAKDKLLQKMYYARYKDTMGGYKVWLELLDLYYVNDFEGMKTLIQSFHCRGGKTRKECLEYLEIIIEGGDN
jgi:hypothetical protein